MKRVTSVTLAVLGLSILATTMSPASALAQRGGGLAGPIEFSATYGSMWGGNVDTYHGTLRTATGASYGFALDIPLHPTTALELSYTYQDGAMDYESHGATTTLTDMSVNFWQIGGVRVLAAGRVQPFVTAAIGMTYFSPEAGSVVVEGETYQVESSTKLSFALGAGFKTYFGQAERFGIRASIKVLPTLYDSDAGVWLGTGGASLGLSGSALWQWEAAGGLTVKFGG